MSEGLQGAGLQATAEQNGNAGHGIARAGEDSLGGQTSMAESVAGQDSLYVVDVFRRGVDADESGRWIVHIVPQRDGELFETSTKDVLTFA